MGSRGGVARAALRTLTGRLEGDSGARQDFVIEFEAGVNPESRGSLEATPLIVHLEKEVAVPYAATKKSDNHDAARDMLAAKVLDSLRESGLEVRQVRPLRQSANRDTTVKALEWKRLYAISGTYETLLKAAEQMRIRKPLKMKSGELEHQLRRTAVFTVARLPEFEYADDPSQFFTSGERLLLLEPIVQHAIGGFFRRKEAGETSMEKDVKDRSTMVSCTEAERAAAAKVCSLVIPLHDEREAHALARRWIFSFTSAQQPLNDVANYFGHDVGFYFAFLGEYTAWLTVPALGGIMVYWQRKEFANKNPNANNTFEYEGNLWFGLGISVWTTVFLEIWKRRQSRLAFEWDTYDFEEGEESDRAEFKEKARAEYDLVADDVHYIVPAARTVVVFCFSFLTCCGLACLGTLTMLYFLFLADIARKEWTGPEWSIFPWEYARHMPTVLYLASMTAFSSISTKVAHWLTDLENHRTMSQHRDALVVKLAVLQFSTYFLSPLFVAFVERDLDKLYSNVFALLGFYNIINQILELGIPLTHSFNSAAKMARRDSKDGQNTDLQVVGRTDMLLAECDGTLFSDYMELWVQMGQVSLFSMIFPLAPLLALLNNVLEIRLDAFKMLRAQQRRIPVRASSIGSWLQLFEVLSYIAVMTNVALAAVILNRSEKQLLAGWSEAQKLLLLVFVEHAVIGIKFFIAAVVPDVPEYIAFLIRSRRSAADKERDHEFNVRIRCQEMLREERKQCAFRTPVDQARHLHNSAIAGQDTKQSETSPQNLLLQWIVDQEESRVNSDQTARYYYSLLQKHHNKSSSRFSDFATIVNVSVAVLGAIFVFTKEARLAVESQ